MGKIKEMLIRAVESQSTPEMIDRLLERSQQLGAFVEVPTAKLGELAAALETEQVNRLAQTYGYVDDPSLD